jgi:acetyl-CoA C-acetyltransferase
MLRTEELRWKPLRVGIVGMGQTKFGKLSDSSSRELVADAFKEALSDAGLARKDISTLIVCSGSHYDKQRSPAGIMAEYVGVNPVPTFHVEAACASSGVGVRVGWSMIQARLHDVIAVVGFQKMTELDAAEVQDVMSRSGDVMWESPFGPTMPAYYAMHARAHMNRYGTTEEQFALVSVKNHKYGAKNPYAMFQKELTLEEILKSRVVASPLKLYDCCANADGAACIILAGGERARKITDAPIWISGLGLASSPMSLTSRSEFASFECSVQAARQAYKMAKVTPRDLDVAEVHDSFTSAEVINYEDLGFCRRGEGGNFIENGETYIGGKIPVNVDGGLLAKGHPVGATGAAHIISIAKQLRNEAGPNQVPKAKVALAHNIGGIGMYAVCTVLSAK